MSKHTILILFISLVTLGLAVAIGTSGILNQEPESTSPSLDQAIQTATQNSFGDQNPIDTAKSIIQNGVNNTSQFGIQDNGRTLGDNNFSLNPTDLKTIEKDQVDKLLDNTKVYFLLRDTIKSTGLNEYISLDTDTRLCGRGCLLIENNNVLKFAPSNMYYLSSFEKDGQVYWIGFSKDAEGYTYAQMSEPNFTNFQNIYFTGNIVTKINQKESNSSIFTFEVKDFEPKTIDFKDKVNITLESSQLDNIGDD